MGDIVVVIAGIVIGTDLVGLGIIVAMNRRSRVREHSNPVPPPAR